ncbi:MAG: sugar phosphate isomerase/epimerase family protein [Planctomycetota bacterium]
MPSTVLGVCSWSLRARTPAELARSVRSVGVAHVQLALDPLRTGAWSLDDTRRELERAAIHVRSGMIGMRGEDYSTLDSIRKTGGVRPDEHWSANRAAAAESARLAQTLGLPLVTFHAGFLPHVRDGERTTMIDRLRTIADVFAERGVHVAFETGQEDAQTLLGVLDELDRPSVGVNFDPANMILYDMGEPVAALRALADRVRQIHVKDARRTRTSGTWGEEVRAGDGEVDWPAFFATLRECAIDCDLMIEREAGDDRLADIAHARELVQRSHGGRV